MACLLPFPLARVMAWPGLSPVAVLMILLICANSFDSFNNKLTELGKKKQIKIGKTQVLFFKTALFQVFFLKKKKKKKPVVVVVTMPKTTGFLLV